MARLPLRFWPYRIAAMLARPILHAYTQKRILKGKEDPERFKEREGFAPMPRPAGPLIWLHCASVGELLSVLPLIHRLCAEGFVLIVTSITKTSAEIAQKRLPQGAFHIYAPWDVPAYGRRFLDHWRPELILFVESELWPNIIFEAERREISLVQINARLSPKSFDGWRKASLFIRRLLQSFALTLAQSNGDAERLKALGAPNVKAVGNLKFDTPTPKADAVELMSFKAALGHRPVWLAASTHPGEEEAVLEAARLILQHYPEALLVLAPRHPNRTDEVLALCRDFNVVRRTSGATIEAQTQVFLIDTIGDMGLAYHLASVCFVAGSFSSINGHTPLEPAKAGCAIVSGPNIINFAEAYAALKEGEGWLKVDDGTSLGQAVIDLFAHDDRRQRMIRFAGDIVSSLGGGLDATLVELGPFLPKAKP